MSPDTLAELIGEADLAACERTLEERKREPWDVFMARHLTERAVSVQSQKLARLMDRFPARLETENGEESLESWGERVESWYVKLREALR